MCVAMPVLVVQVPLRQVHQSAVTRVGRMHDEGVVSSLQVNFSFVVVKGCVIVRPFSPRSIGDGVSYHSSPLPIVEIVAL